MSCKLTNFAAAFGAVAALTCGGSWLAAEDIATKIDFAKNGVGTPPADFEFQQSGPGDFGRWMVVHDPTATGGLVIEHVSTDQHEDRFPLAIYQPISAENVEARVRLKIVSGPLKTAGFAVGLRNPDSYYAVSANAFEHRVDLLLFSGGKPTRVDGAEANVMADRWHTLGVTVNDDHFTVSLDQKVLFTAFERTRMKDGRVALWTQEDNVTRFDQFEVRVMPPTPWR